jgi:OCT family organic cation transporter-like MFS transporter 4/5
VSKNKPEKAMEVMRKAAKWNGVTLKHNNELTESDSETTDSTESGGFIAIVKHPLLRRWSFNLWFNWATNALVYYGLSLSASKIGDGLDVYTTFMLLAAVEIPFGIAISIIMSLLGRRLPLSVTMMTGGVICLMPAVLPASLSKATVILGVLGKGCITASFALVYFYTAEVYPTNMRSVGLGTSSTFARVGAIIAPFVAEFKGLGESGPLIICGAISLIAGLLALDLPETHKKDLPETIDDVYKLKKGFKATSLTREDELTKSRIP